MSNPIKVLIVDDDPRNIRILNEMLEDVFMLGNAENGSEALNKIDTFQPQLVLLDSMMPDLDGLEVCRLIRNNEQHSKLKIIIVSGRAGKTDLTEGINAGANAYLTKPFDENKLMETIHDVLEIAIP